MTYIYFRSNIGPYWLIIPKYGGHISNSLQDIRQNHWTMKYRSQWPTFIFRSNIRSYWLILPKYGVHISNSLQDIRQNHWTMKYRSQWPTFIFRSNIGPYWLIIPKYGGHISNSLQDIRQNHWTMKYRSHWPMLKIGEKEKWWNKGTNKQQRPDSSIYDTSAYCPHVYQVSIF